MNKNKVRGYYVKDEFRTSEHSLIPGGATITVYEGKDFKVYDKVKYPKAYISTIVNASDTVTEIRMDGKIVWIKKK